MTRKQKVRMERTMRKLFEIIVVVVFFAEVVFFVVNVRAESWDELNAEFQKRFSIGQYEGPSRRPQAW